MMKNVCAPVRAWGGWPIVLSGGEIFSLDPILMMETSELPCKSVSHFEPRLAHLLHTPFTGSVGVVCTLKTHTSRDRDTSLII